MAAGLLIAAHCLAFAVMVLVESLCRPRWPHPRRAHHSSVARLHGSTARPHGGIVNPEGRATYTVNSPLRTLSMGFGWAERRLVSGPQGPPCSSAPGFECWVFRVSVSSATVVPTTCIVLNHHKTNFGCCSGLNIRLRCIILVGFDHLDLMLSCSELIQYYRTNLFLIIPLHL